VNGITDGARVGRKLMGLAPKAQARIKRANETTGAEWMRLAKVLIPVRSGYSQQNIMGRPVEATNYLIEFPLLTRILEGGRKPGVSKKGRAYPGMQAFPHVNPAKSIVLPKHRRRIKAAIRAAIKEAGS
jgi:hypothetical protein